MKTADLKDVKLRAYEAISRDPRAAFPEFNFVRKLKGWNSSNARKIDGGDGTAVGKVWIYDSRPGYLYDFRGGESVGFWDYLQQVRGITTPLKELAELADVPLPDSDEEESIDPVAGVHPRVLREAWRAFRKELTTADDVMGYLRDKRGYAEEIVARMRLGALPEAQKLARELGKLPIDGKYVRFFIGKIERAARRHRLAIPLFGEGGRLTGFTFRVVAALPDGEPKYLNLAGTETNASVLDLPRNAEEIVLVEGQLDALLLRAYGRRNVAPLSGSGLSEENIAAIAARGVRRVVLCLDNDAAGRKATLKIAERILSRENPPEIFVMALPDGIKDADELVRTYDVEAFDGLLAAAKGAGEYFGEALAERFPNPRPGLPFPALPRSRLLDEAGRYAGLLRGFPVETHDLSRKLHRHLEDSQLLTETVRQEIKERLPASTANPRKQGASGEKSGSGEQRNGEPT
jgi:DNA primase